MVPEIIAEVQITYSSKVKACDRFRVTGSKDAAKAFRSIWPSYEHVEFIYMLMLNRQNQVLGCHQISKGHGQKDYDTLFQRSPADQCQIFIKLLQMQNQDVQCIISNPL